MARIDTLANFLTDVAEAIRTKEGTTETITASEFDTRISNLSGGEDLTEELNTYGSELEEQNVTLDDIAKALRVKGSGSSANTPNIFMQEEEPETKEGLWLQTDKEYDYIDITKIVGNDQWDYEQKTNLGDGLLYGASVRIGNYVYLMGGDKATKAMNVYNLTTNTYEKKADIPMGMSYCPAVAQGNNIYLSQSTYFYKYDIATNTYTSLNTRGITNFGSKLETGDSDTIYSFGGEAGAATMYKYTISTNTWTKMANMPMEIIYSTTIKIGTDIYLFSVRKDNMQTFLQDIYKFDITNETFSVAGTCPGTVGTAKNQPCQALQEDNENLIILTYGKEAYRWNFVKNTWKKLPDTTEQYRNACSTIYDNNIVLFGGEINAKQVVYLTLSEADFRDKTVLIDCARDGFENGFRLFNIDDSKILQNVNTYYLNDVGYYENNDTITNIPTYIGDGTQWVKFKN